MLLSQATHDSSTCSVMANCALVFERETASRQVTKPFGINSSGLIGESGSSKLTLFCEISF